MARASGVLRVIVETELSLGEPNVDEGLVTWFDVRVAAGEGADSAVIGNARAARIHVGEASNLGEPLYHVLDADSGELEALYDVFFEEDWFRDQFTMGAGSDPLFVSQLDLKPGWEGRNIGLALVRRLCDTIGEGCAPRVAMSRPALRLASVRFACADSVEAAQGVFSTLKHLKRPSAGGCRSSHRHSEPT